MVSHIIFLSHLKKDSRKMINRYVLKVSSCIVPQLISMGSVVPKWLLVKDVVEFLYIFSIISIASRE